MITSTLKLVNCQGKNLIGNFTPIADLRLKCCMEKRFSKMRKKSASHLTVSV